MGNGGAGNYAGSAVTFTPTADGFNLAGNFSSSSSLASDSMGQLSYTVRVTDGTLTGLTTDINGPSFSLAPLSGVSTALTVAENGTLTPNGPVGGDTFVNPDVGQEYGSAPQDVTYTQDSTTPSLLYSSSSNFAGVTSESGFAFIETTVYNYSVLPDGLFECCGSGSATDSLISADFGFEVTPAPEPGVWWSLLAMGRLSFRSAVCSGVELFAHLGEVHLGQ